MQTKTLIAILVLVVGVGAGIYLYSRRSKGLESTGPADEFSIDDDAAYKGARSLFTDKELAWIDPLVKTSYESTDKENYIGSRKSKTKAFIRMIGRVNPNKDGKFKDRSGNVALWEQSFIDRLWDEFKTPLEAKYGGI